MDKQTNLTESSETFQKPNLLRTLPDRINDIVGETVTIKDERAQYIIEALGNLLGITDYKTNMASFWFLDILALQLVHYKQDLNDYYNGILVSWLTGEMKLIQDKKFSRIKFFEWMKDIFVCVVKEIVENDQLPYWASIVRKVHDLNADDIDEVESTTLVGSVHEKQVNESKSILQNKNSNAQINSKASKLDDRVIESGSTTELMAVFNIIIDSTYKIYGDEMRYNLIFAVFVKPIEKQIYHLPFTFQTPRLSKVASHQGNFDIQLYKVLTDLEKDMKRRKAMTKRKKRIDAVSTPPNSLTDEDFLAAKREFILPLIESKESSEIFGLYSRNK